MKTAKLYAWVALQTLPEEMVISPCLLDFLEKALETIPITPVERSYAGASPLSSAAERSTRAALQSVDCRLVCGVAALASQEEDMGQFDTVEPLEESTTSLVSSSTSAYSSFPVDVVVYVRVQVLAVAPEHCAATSVVFFHRKVIFPPPPTYKPHSIIRRFKCLNFI